MMFKYLYPNTISEIMQYNQKIWFLVKKNCDIMKENSPGGLNMRKNLKPSPSITPMPVLIIGSYHENGTHDAMNAAWGTACDSTQLCIFIAKSHKTFKNIMLKKGIHRQSC